MPRLLGLLLLFLAAATAVPARAALLAIAPAETTVTVGDPVTLRVTVDNVADLKGCDLIYGYTPLRLSFDVATAGDALAGLAGSVFAAVLPDVSAPADSVWFDAARLDGSGAGPGVVVFLRFLTHTTGNATVSCLATDVRNSLNAPIPLACDGALVHVIGPVPVTRRSWGQLKAVYR